MTATAEHSQRLEFKTELKQLLHLITHSLYSNKEIFLRELISNASDAINKLKFDSLSHQELLEGNKDWKIKVTLDKANRTLTVSDNGVGLSRDAAVDNLGTIAKAGTRHRRHAPPEAGGGRVPRPLPRPRRRQEVLRLHRVPGGDGRREGGGRQEGRGGGAAQLQQGALAAHAVRGDAGGVQRLLQA